MCRSIKVLRAVDAPPSDSDIRAAALQFVRKISGYRHPSQVNLDAFETAVEEIATASGKLLGSLKHRQPAGSRQA